MAIVEVGRLNERAVPAIAGFRVDFIRDWKAAAACWVQAGHGTAFQHVRWLEAWYEVFDSALPLIAIISDEISGRQIALVPLICRVHGGIRIVEFADLNITDYNAPILSQGILLDEAQSRALCKTLLLAQTARAARPCSPQKDAL
jgi:CelD/BcsL family acetyltransferase involved in cellulose biosynthesis